MNAAGHQYDGHTGLLAHLTAQKSSWMLLASERLNVIHVSTHGEGGTVIVKGDVQGRVGGQMVKGEIYVLGAIEHMLPGFKKVGTVEKDVDGTNYRLDHYVGDLGERHPSRRGEQILGNLYVRAAA